MLLRQICFRLTTKWPTCRVRKEVRASCRREFSSASEKPAAHDAYSDVASSADSKKLSFRQTQSLRRNQAHRSIIVQGGNVERAAAVQQECDKCGHVLATFHYRQLDKEYLLLEMDSQSSVQNVLESCAHPAREDIVPVRSRLLDASSLRSRTGLAARSLVSEDFFDEPSLDQELRQQDSISEQMQTLYERSLLSEVGVRLRYFIASQVEDTISGLFANSRVFLFGSSVNGFGHHRSDVDMILDFDTSFTQKKPGKSGLRFVAKQTAGNDRVQTQRSLELLADNLQYLLPGYSQVQRILLARVPIVKFFHDVSGVRCDLSITNIMTICSFGSILLSLAFSVALSPDMPVYRKLLPLLRMGVDSVRLLRLLLHRCHWLVVDMCAQSKRSYTLRSGLVMSSYLHALGQIDPRLRILVVTIRRWAEANRLTSPHPGRWITNFTLTILVVFFMQHKTLLPALSHLSDPDWLSPSAYPAKPVQELSHLLAEFFDFYSAFDYKNNAISVIKGKTFSKPDLASLYIENPLETELNVSRNLSGDELDRFVHAVRGGLWVLESLEKDASQGLGKLFQEFSRQGKNSKVGSLNLERLFKSADSPALSKKYQPDQISVTNAQFDKNSLYTGSVRKKTYPNDRFDTRDLSRNVVEKPVRNK